jgi:hypothetical protein
VILWKKNSENKSRININFRIPIITAIRRTEAVALCGGQTECAIVGRVDIFQIDVQFQTALVEVCSETGGQEIPVFAVAAFVVCKKLNRKRTPAECFDRVTTCYNQGSKSPRLISLKGESRLG